MCDTFNMPRSFDELCKGYAFHDVEEIYTNGGELIPTFRVKQWIEMNGMDDGLYTRHEVACIIADLFGGTCACDYSGNDEWLPQYCEFADKVCPNTVGVACWEQYLEHMDRKAGAE